MNGSHRMQRNYARHCCNFGFDRWRRHAKKEKNSRIHPSFLCTLRFLAPCWEWSHDSIHSSIMAATSLSTWTRVPPQPTRIPPRVCFATVSIFLICFSSCYLSAPLPCTQISLRGSQITALRVFGPHFFFFFFWICSSHTAVILSKESITFKRSELRSI